jgi:tetratricopeptide (TPR) repeat protein/DNA-binding CsgD family transcriptional regulator
MPDTEEQIRNRLAETSDPIEKLDLTIELANKMLRKDPASSRELASRVLRIARAKKDTLRMAQSTTVLGFCEYYQTNYPLALKQFQQAMLIAEKLDDVRIPTRIHYGLGIIYVSMRDFPRAMEELTHALELSEADGPVELQGYIQNAIAMAFVFLSDFTRAFEYFRQALNCFESLHDESGEAMILNNMGRAYMSLGDLQQAFESFVRSNALTITSDDVRTRAYTLVSLGDVLRRQEKYNEAMGHYTQALDLSRVVGDTHLEAMALSIMGAIHLLKSDRDLDAAFGLCQQALEIAERTRDGSLWQHTIRIGEVLYARKEYDRALEYYNKALEGMRTQGDRFSEYQILLNISECYEAMGDVVEAFTYHKLYTSLKEEVVGQQKQREMMQFRMRVEQEQAEKDREILRLEKQGLEQEMTHRMKELTSTALHVVEKNEFLDSLKREISEVVRTVDGKVRPALRGLLRQVDAKINDAEDWDAFERQFELVHHDFIRNMSHHCRELTKTELKVCALLRIDLATKDIARILSTSVRTVEVHRRNIRRKLGITKQTTLTTYLNAF